MSTEWVEYILGGESTGKRGGETGDREGVLLESVASEVLVVYQ